MCTGSVVVATAHGSGRPAESPPTRARFYPDRSREQAYSQPRGAWLSIPPAGQRSTPRRRALPPGAEPYPGNVSQNCCLPGGSPRLFRRRWDVLGSSGSAFLPHLPRHSVRPGLETGARLPRLQVGVPVIKPHWALAWSSKSGRYTPCVPSAQAEVPNGVGATNEMRSWVTPAGPGFYRQTSLLGQWGVSHTLSREPCR